MPRGVYNRGKRNKKVQRRERQPQILRRDPQVEAPSSTHLGLIRKACGNLPFSFTVFFTDEHNNTVKYGQFYKVQTEY